MKTRDAVSFLKDNLRNIRCEPLPDGSFKCEYFARNGHAVLFQLYGSDRKNRFYIDNGSRRIRINVKEDSIETIKNKILEFEANRAVQEKIEDIKRNILNSSKYKFDYTIYKNNVRKKAKEIGFTGVNIRNSDKRSFLIFLSYDVYEAKIGYRVVSGVYEIRGLTEISYKSNDIIDKKSFIDFSGKIADLIHYLQRYTEILKEMNLLEELDIFF